MKNYKITVNGNTYEVGVEEVGGAPVVKAAPVAAAPKAAPAPAPKPAPAPAAAPAAPAAAPASAGAGDIFAPLPGSVLSVNVSEGDSVKSGQVLLVFEAMKMENEIVSPRDGTVKKVHVSKGTMLESGVPVITLG
jgi:glutaconyl-CoA decarboxylase